jgi:hypothetical protein
MAGVANHNTSTQNLRLLDATHYGKQGKLKCVTNTESRLEGGVNRQNLKIINLSTHYKSGLALEIKSSPKERVKTNQRQMKRMTR